MNIDSRYVSYQNHIKMILTSIYVYTRETTTRKNFGSTMVRWHDGRDQRDPR